MRGFERILILLVAGAAALFASPLAQTPATETFPPVLDPTKRASAVTTVSR